MIVEILSSQIGLVGQMDFVVVADSSALQVAVNPPGGPLDFENSAGDSLFQPGDNILLQWIQVSIPFGFGQAAGQASLDLSWQLEAGGGFVPIPELAGEGLLTIPNICSSLKFAGSGLAIQTPTSEDGTRVAMCLGVAFDLNVSMVNVPAVLVGERVWAQVHMMVAHTRPMVSPA